MEKILQRSDKDKITFQEIEKHRFGIGKTVSKHLKILILYQRCVGKSGQERSTSKCWKRSILRLIIPENAPLQLPRTIS